MDTKSKLLVMTFLSILATNAAYTAAEARLPIAYPHPISAGAHPTLHSGSSSSGSAGHR